MEEPHRSISGRDVILALLRRRQLVVGTYAAIVLGSLAAAFLATPEYRSATKILFTTDRAQISTSAERPTELVRTNQVSDAEMSSQLQILQGRELVEEVLTDLGVKPAAPADGGPGILHTLLSLPRTLISAPYRRLHKLDDVEPNSPLYWEAELARQRIDAARVGKSNIIEIGFTSPDPSWSRDFVNRLTTAYVERQARLLQIGDAQDFFTNQSRLLQQKLSTSEAELRDLQQKAGALAGRREEIYQRLNEFSADLARTKVSRAEQDQRVGYLERMQASAGRVATPQLLELEARRAEMVGRYRPDSERIKDIDEQIRRLRSAVASYDAGAAGTDSASDLMGARASLAALKGREEALTRERDEFERQVVLLDAQNFDLARLQRQVKIDEEAYLSYVRTAEQSRLSNALEQSKLLRLTVIEPATVPVAPVSPKKGRMILFGLVGGLVVALGVGMARDLFDGSIKTTADVERFANLEVLATLPERP